MMVTSNILVCMKNNNIVKTFFSHGGPKVGPDKSETRKAPFSSTCSDWNVYEEECPPQKTYLAIGTLFKVSAMVRMLVI